MELPSITMDCQNIGKKMLMEWFHIIEGFHHIQTFDHQEQLYKIMDFLRKICIVLKESMQD